MDIVTTHHTPFWVGAKKPIVEVMKISKVIFHQEGSDDHKRRVGSKKHALSVPKGPSSPALRLLEKALSLSKGRPQPF